MSKKEEKIKAEHLVVVDGMQQKEVHKILGVAEKTISQWAKEGNWKAKSQNRSEAIIAIETALIGFLGYLDQVSPNIHAQVKELHKSYIKLLKI